eukprot:TRINITY_DN416_c0_g1_i5.p2 TRINITY_DN416_c0_g1~~TRINITY_DN416_c0_g1_i5.p2  ORF type:complete len:299 (+),score=64.05 TRINITY_DN416_c0_g1_i5:2044-2940(+)
MSKRNLSDVLGQLEQLQSMLEGSKRKRSAFKADLDLETLFAHVKTALAAPGATAISVGNAILDQLPFTPGSLPFSAVENEDIKFKSKTLRFIKEKAATAKGLSGTFSRVLNILGLHWNRKAETSRRTMIDLFLLDAVNGGTDGGEDVVSDKDLIVYPEFQIKGTKIAETLTVHGYIDYVVGSSGNDDKEDRVARLKLGTTELRGACCIIEAKQDESFGAGEGQAIAEFAAAARTFKQKIYGVLTDGDRWRFFFIPQPFDGLFYHCAEIFTIQDHKNVIAAAVRSFVGGELPPFFALPS